MKKNLATKLLAVVAAFCVVFNLFGVIGIAGEAVLPAKMQTVDTSKLNSASIVNFYLGTNTLSLNTSSRSQAKPLPDQVEGTTYYVNAILGNDKNDGKSADTAWKSLNKVNKMIFLPGDSILLKSGTIYNGYLWPQGSGTKQAPITLGKYGGDAKPIINATGSPGIDYGDNPIAEHKYHPTVFLCDQDYWVIEHLEVTNQATTQLNNVGILIFTTGTTGHTYDITVRDCFVHDVVAKEENAKMTGGILAVGSTKWIDGSDMKNVQKKVGFDGILFENNHVKNVAKEGIRTTGLVDRGPFRNKKAHKNVVIRGNYIEEIFGDGIVLSEVGSGGIVEYNIIKNHCNTESLNFAGCWTWYCSDAVFRCNEVFGGVYGYQDGEAFDFDIGSEGIIFEYNFSHDNFGGLLLTMPKNGRASNIFRYNISANDGSQTQSIFHVNPQDVRVYNNTIYVGEGVSTTLFHEGKVNYFKNNIVMVDGTMLKFSETAVKAGAIENNIFYPAEIMKVNGLSKKVLAKNIIDDPMLASAADFADEYKNDYNAPSLTQAGNTQAFLAALHTRAADFKITANSPAADAGMVLETAPKLDFYANPVDAKPDIGAHEVSYDALAQSDPEKIEPPKVTLSSVIIYVSIAIVIAVALSVSIAMFLKLKHKN